MKIDVVMGYKGFAQWQRHIGVAHYQIATHAQMDKQKGVV